MRKQNIYLMKLKVKIHYNKGLYYFVELIDSKGFFDRYESQLESIFINYPEPILKLIKMKLDKETDQFKAKFMKKILNHSNNIK